LASVGALALRCGSSDGFGVAAPAGWATNAAVPAAAAFRNARRLTESFLDFGMYDTPLAFSREILL
jgi:hypothetical protein